MTGSRVVWSEGLFLQQQHFQQQERFFESQLVRHVQLAAEWQWGFAELKLDTGLNSLGKLGLTSARGILRDGSLFDVPGQDPLPQPLDVPLDARNELVYLAMPLALAGRAQFDLTQSEEAALARYVAETHELTDVLDPALKVPALLGRQNLQLVMQRELSGAWVALPVARVIECLADGRVSLDDSFVPPTLALTASPVLEAWLKELAGLVRQRAMAVAARVGAPKSSVADIAEFLLLQTLNRYSPGLEQMVARNHCHPSLFFGLGQTLLGDLSIFANENRLASDVPLYLHDAPEACFPPLIAELRRMLSMVFEQSAIAIELQERNYGIRVAIVPDSGLFEQSKFVLAAKGQLASEVLRNLLPSQIKIGPVEKIRDLISLQLPGVRIAALPVVPHQIPFHAGFNYFELEKGSEFWQQLSQSAGLALHVAGDFPGLELELWAVRS
ncbi:type VI secretion system protein ImpJ [Andreprevotia lacus DSM 23236]|jgi:type VI secretion system protein ImpJ|uniref:Type VI secretion system protein ImpJ n=1 Tax=Andreprevotia lacus DSM 23236 TaxID=1121001 RepID=A0A1W1XM05_9NEIS|nr:type VI secretion system baseplate subunit TssK [Andreprevotia lacus]SMC25009.1 type VI secretion system protein ImpJ [Andreprevotia lacus DSM 23236]